MSTISYDQPRPLKPGDTIGVCAPSGSFDLQIFSRGVRVLESMGFNVHIPDEIYSKKRYMAGDDKVRANVINGLFENSDIDGIICARGGFGALRILDYIDYNLISKNKKLFVGFSDITALLVTISERTFMQVIHGPVITTLADAHSETLEMLYRQLTLCASDDCDIDANHDIFNVVSNRWEGKVLRSGATSGRLTGGNLSTLCHLTGTRFQPDLNGTILFIEDIGEAPYKVDRMLTQMRLAGVLAGVRGVIIGSFYNLSGENKTYEKSLPGDDDRDQKSEALKNQKMIEEIVLEIFDNPELPVFSGIDAGHGRINLSLRFSATVEMNSEQKKG